MTGSTVPHYQIIEKICEGGMGAVYKARDSHLDRFAAIKVLPPEPEDEKVEHVTYQELYVRVNELAAILKDFCGLKAGDTVTLHMPMVAELLIPMLACARLGIIHSQ